MSDATSDSIRKAELLGNAGEHGDSDELIQKLEAADCNAGMDFAKGKADQEHRILTGIRTMGLMSQRKRSEEEEPNSFTPTTPTPSS